MSDFDASVMEELISESREHLDNIEPDLLDLEHEQNKANLEGINRIFRAVHSIKGGFAFFGLTHIKELSHAMENVLSPVRDGAQTVSSGMVDALLAGIDKLRVMLDDVAHSENIPIDDEIGALRQFLPGAARQDASTAASSGATQPPGAGQGASAEKKPAAEAAVPQSPWQGLEGVPLNVAQLHDARKHGKTIYRVTLRCREELADRNLTLAQVAGSLRELGDILASAPDLGASEEEIAEKGGVAIAYATVLEPGLVSQFLDLPESQVAQINVALLEIQLGGDSGSAAVPVKIPKRLPAKNAPVDGKPKPASPEGEKKTDSPQSLRVRVDLLDRLVNLAGELVLGRNQMKQRLGHKLSDSLASDARFRAHQSRLASARKRLMEQAALLGNGQAMALQKMVETEFNNLVTSFKQALEFPILDVPGLGGVVQNVDLVTSELQGGIMDTRMQPVGTVFSKFPRVIRDMAKKLGKEIELVIEGEDVELDKSIVEALSDPLTHLIRNSADHGIEMPDVRESAGKPPAGRIELRAYHEAGQVNIDIVDDGAGMDAERLKAKAIERGLLTRDVAERMSEREAFSLIFQPGFSMAKEVSDISGRGVGMDVVRTNIQKIGGVVEIESHLGNGSRISLKLPLTLAIIPSLIVQTEGRTFAVPQVNLEELVRVRAKDVAERIENVQGNPVMRLRNKILPLVRLNELMGLGTTYEKKGAGRQPDRRRNLVDRRAPDLLAQLDNQEAEEAPEANGGTEDREQRFPTEDRRRNRHNALNILVLKMGARRFGLIVEKLRDCQEIVVKALPSYLKSSGFYSGATIMGDGSVAMILDASGIAKAAGLQFGDVDKVQRHMQETLTETQRLLLFSNGTTEVFALPLAMVARVEKVQTRTIEKVGGKEYMKYSDSSLRILRLDDFLPVQRPDEPQEEIFVIVPKLIKHPTGIVASRILDVIETTAPLDRKSITGRGILGSIVANSELRIVVDLYDLFEVSEPEIYARARRQAKLEGLRVLLAEDTDFFRHVEARYLEELGCQVETAKDGEAAWEKLISGNFDMLITDIVMPRLDGMELTRRVRASAKFMELPVIALTSLMSEEDRRRIENSGVDAYEVKLDKDRLREAMAGLLLERGGGHQAQ